MSRAGASIDATGVAAAVVGGVVWLLVWVHQASAHSMTELDEMEVVLSLTWMDSYLTPVLPYRG